MFSTAEEISPRDDIKIMKPGEAILLKVHGKPLYVYKVTDNDLNNLGVLDNHVYDSKRAPFVREIGVFAVWAISTKSTCVLRYMAPKEKSSGNSWFGGYYDPCGDVNYDISGRVIKTIDFTMNNYAMEYPNLSYPKIRYTGGTEIEIYNSGI